MHQLKQISKDAIEAALEKALRYRLLNEPQQAESICRDVLAVDQNHQQALVTMLLALTDQFDTQFTTALEQAKQVTPRLIGQYDQQYYAGIINERWANAQLARGVPGHVALGWYREAMWCYERAQTLATSNDPDSVLRWNTCA